MIKKILDALKNNKSAIKKSLVGSLAALVVAGITELVDHLFGLF